MRGRNGGEMRLLRWSSLNWTFAAEGAGPETTEGGREGLCPSLYVRCDNGQAQAKAPRRRGRGRACSAARGGQQAGCWSMSGRCPSLCLPSPAAAADGSTMKGQKVPPSPFDLRRRRRRSQRHTRRRTHSVRGLPPEGSSDGWGKEEPRLLPFTRGT